MSWRARISRNLDEIRFHFCGHSKSGSHVRSFLENNYHDLKKLNPMFPFLIREHEDETVDPYLIFCYDLGVEEIFQVTGKSEKEIEEIVKAATLKGATMPRANMDMGWDDIRPEERSYRSPDHIMKLITTPTELRPERLIFGPPKVDDYTGPSDINDLDEDMRKAGLQ